MRCTFEIRRIFSRSSSSGNAKFSSANPPIQIRQQAGLRFFEKVSKHKPPQVREVRFDNDATLYEKL